MHRRVFDALCALVLACAACEGETSGEGSGGAGDDGALGPGGGLDVGAGSSDAGANDGSAPGDAAPDPDAAPEVDAAPDAAPPPLAPPAELRPVAARWRVAQVRDPNRDPVAQALAAGPIACPEPGEAHGVQWADWTPDAEGRLRETPGGLLYALACLDTPEPVGLVARGDTVFEMRLGAAAQPGDIYHSRRLRAPLRTEPGANVVVFVAAGGRSVPEAALGATTDELWFNLDDVTVPDLPVGEASEQFVGVPILNLTGAPVLDVTARALGPEVETTRLVHPALPAGAVTQIPFAIRPRAPWAGPDRDVSVTVRIESPSLQFAYERTLTLRVVPASATHRRTFRSAMDGSAQYYGVVPPADFDPSRRYGLILTLHGAGVQGIGQAQAYSPKDWAWVVAPTNRRPFGFDWEEWGRLDALEVLEDASARFDVDPTRVHVTGHSMGGHGTWQMGVLFPGRFATVAPSAGWSSFYSYTGRARPTGPFARSQASSDSAAYLTNLARRAVYIVHGDADDNVPVREARDMHRALVPIAPDLTLHEEPGAGHWWDGERSPGADCVDWPPLMEVMADRRLDPLETTFHFTMPTPRVNARHAYVTVTSITDPGRDFALTSEPLGDDAVALTTDNVRGLVLDGAGLRARGVESAVVNGTSHDLPDGPLPLGAQTGKRPDAHGPFNQVFQQPFCFVYDPDGQAAFRHYAAWLTSTYQFIGNGSACAVPLSEVDDELRATRNLVYLGIRPRRIGGDLPFTWDDIELVEGDRHWVRSALAFVFPHHGRLGAVMTATHGSEALLFQLSIFHSGFALPDFLIWSPQGARATGFLDAEWRYDRGLVAP